MYVYIEYNVLGPAVGTVHTPLESQHQTRYTSTLAYGLPWQPFERLSNRLAGRRKRALAACIRAEAENELAWAHVHGDESFVLAVAHRQRHAVSSS